MIYLSFQDWDQAQTAVMTPVSENANLTGYKVAPQLFYFSPQNLWYLVYQTQEPTYSTTEDPGDVKSWSPMTTFISMPAIITNSDTGGIDYWVICDDTDCYMFFSADNGVLYRARTSKSLFPNGFEGTTEIVMQDDQYDLFDASNVYKLEGEDKYLLLVSAIDGGGIERYFRAWTADNLAGNWTPLADTKENSFASINNVTNTNWFTSGIVHGEMLRTNPDESMTISTCHMQYLFSGLVSDGTDTDNDYYTLGLLTSNE
jgi:endo-1,4-beta-xylanase